MTDNSQNFDNLQERNEQTLSNISQLQSTEQQLYDSLDNVSLTSEQKQEIITKINEISQMRLNLYANMKDMYTSYQNNVSSSQNTLSEQMGAIDIIENELNESKRRMNLLNDQKNNKLRMVEINTYYGKRYNAHANIMKTIFIFCIPIIILAVLANSGILPPNIYSFLSGVIIVVAVILIGYQLIDLSNRDNMNWDEYNWYFNKSDAPTDSSDGTSSSSSNPWSTPSITCVGSECCYEGSTYDSSQNICVPNPIYNQSSTNTSSTNTSSTNTSSTNTSSNDTTVESMVSGVLSKYAYSQTPPVARLNGGTVFPVNY